MSEREWISQESLRRIEGEIAAKGPAIVRRAGIVRRAQIGAVITGVIAAGIALVLAPRSEPIVQEQIAVRTGCRGRAAPSVQERRTGGAVRFDLGEVATAELSPGSRGAVLEVSQCTTVFALESGRIDVHARDLGGGELVVVAGERRVTVHGTIFSVERNAGLFAVHVREGRVAVSGHPEMLKAGDRLVVEPEPEQEQELQPIVKRSKPKKRASTERRVERRVRSKRFDLDLDRAPDVEEIEEPIETPKFEPAIDPPPRPKQAAKEEPKAEPEPRESPEELVRIAGRLRARGDLEGARKLYRRAGALDGPTAEAAWIALARTELEVKQGARALAALAEHSKRFSGGSLVIEAAWLRVQAHELAGDRSAAEREARALIRRWPATEQARSAKAWLERSD